MTGFDITSVMLAKLSRTLLSGFLLSVAAVWSDNMISFEWPGKHADQVSHHSSWCCLLLNLCGQQQVSEHKSLHIIMKESLKDHAECILCVQEKPFKRFWRGFAAMNDAGNKTWQLWMTRKTKCGFPSDFCVWQFRMPSKLPPQELRVHVPLPHIKLSQATPVLNIDPWNCDWKRRRHHTHRSTATIVFESDLSCYIV